MRQQLYSSNYFIDALAALNSKLTLSHVFLECLYLWLCAFLRIGLRMSLPSTNFCNVLLDDYTYAPTSHGTIEAVSSVSRHAYPTSPTSWVDCGLILLTTLRDWSFSTTTYWYFPSWMRFEVFMLGLFREFGHKRRIYPQSQRFIFVVVLTHLLLFYLFIQPIQWVISSWL